jgi:hypothetical protein
MTFPELLACVDRLGIRLSLRLVVDAPAGVITQELLDALLTHKPALLALLAQVDDRTESAGPPAAEPTEDVGAHAAAPSPAATLGPGPGPSPWPPRPAALATWPTEWRQRWGELANTLQDRGIPWPDHERLAFNQVREERVEKIKGASK